MLWKSIRVASISTIRLSKGLYDKLKNYHLGAAEAPWDLQDHSHRKYTAEEWKLL